MRLLVSALLSLYNDTMKNLLTILLSMCAVFSFAQNKGLIYYGHIESPGMRGAVGPDLNAYLVFDENESYYVTAKDSLETSINDTAVSTGPDGQTTVFTGGSNTFRYGKQVYFNRASDSLWWSQRFRGNIYVAEPRPSIAWELTSESKKIGDLTAYKATGFFRGRNYTAWYIREIPLPYGPWKLQGLPGLIVEAFDERKEMYIYFKGLEFPTKSQAPISKVKRPEEDSLGWLTLMDFKDMQVKSLQRAHNQTVLMSEKYGGGRPEKPAYKDVYIESFEN
jgi:GLPGLI family protein